jgi:AcrR family transcriptional regulator
VPTKKPADKSKRRTKVDATRTRDVAATKRRLIEAVAAILARDGFSALGINAIASEARTDKALIYRYFGGLPDLLEAYAESESFWPTVEEVAGGSLKALAEMPLVARWEHALHHYIVEIRKRPLTQEILAWELSERNEVTARLEDVRERRGLSLMKVLAKGAPRGFDVPAVTGLFASSVHYLVLRARKIRVFNGIDLRTEVGWERLEHAAKAMVLGALHHATR